MSAHEQTSQEFQDAFDARMGSCRGKCHCGREYFDVVNDGIDWNEGEFERLQQLARDPASKVFEAGGSISFIEVDGLRFVWGCQCGGAKKYEDFLLRNAPQIAHYLRLRAERLQREAKALSV